MSYSEHKQKFDTTSFAKARSTAKVASHDDLEYAKARQMIMGEIVPQEETKSCCLSKSRLI